MKVFLRTLLVAAAVCRPGSAADGGVAGRSLAECDTAIREGRVKDALPLCQRAVAEDASSARAHDLLAHALVDSARWPEAIKEAERAAALRPEWADPYVVIGIAQMQAGNPQPARKAFARYLQMGGPHEAEVRKMFNELDGAAGFAPKGPIVVPASVERSSLVTIVAALPQSAEVGQKITVVPVRQTMRPAQLDIRKVQFDSETDVTPANWLIWADTADPAYGRAKADPGVSIEHPFEAVVIYPAAPDARLMSRKAVGSDIPAAGGLTAAGLWAAIDVDGDGRADAEIFRFCCDKPARPLSRSGPSRCEADCEKTFVRAAGGTWTLAAQSAED